jgi:anti-sigma factor RsiW
MAAADHIHSPTPEEIMEYLDGEGTVASRAGIEAHLVDCGTCQVMASEHRRLSEDIHEWPVEPAPASLRPPMPPRSRLLPWRLFAWPPSRLTWFTVGAAAAVVVVLFVSPPPRRTASVAATPAASVTVGGGGAGQASPRGSGVAVSEEAEALTYSSRLYSRDQLARRQAPAQMDSMPQPDTSQGAVRRPSVIRTATLRIVTKDFDGVRPAVEGIVTAAGGFVDRMTATSDPGSVRALRGTLRIPADGLANVANRLRQLGQVIEDTQGSEDVADQLVDLGARLTSARATELRLTELLKNRTGKLSDVLEVERELARVRIDIERLDAETTNIGRRVSYATMTIEIVEERKAGLIPGPLSLGSRFRIAASDGLESAMESVTGALLFLLTTGPFLVLWSLVLGSAWLIVRRALGSRMSDSR